MIYMFTYLNTFLIVYLLFVVLRSLGPRFWGRPYRLTNIVDTIAIAVYIVLCSISIGVHHLKRT